MDVNVKFISGCCNRTYNCLELTENFLLFGGNHALVAYDLQKKQIVKTVVSHKGQINCVRFLKNSSKRWLLTCAADGMLILWNYSEKEQYSSAEYLPDLSNSFSIWKEECHVMKCDGIVKNSEALVGFITSHSKIVFGLCDLRGTEPAFVSTQIIDLKNSIALDLVFHQLISDQIVVAIGKDSGAVTLYYHREEENSLVEFCNLRKHEDWVRCISFCQLDNGETLLATGGQDSFIAVWRFKDNKELDTSITQQFEFQSYSFKNFTILFDSMIIGHEGWITSLDFNSQGKLLSCSSDQSIILWSNFGDIWSEETRLGAVGGETPGGFGAKLNDTMITTWGFQGAIQIWNMEEDEWVLQPSVTGHFKAITDFDYNPDGHFIVTTSRDQTTRVYSSWGPDKWHEIARPQIHGHDIFALKCCGEFVVSGAEEKILRVFQPTQVLVQMLDEVSDITTNFKHVAEFATLPALGLSNQSSTASVLNDLPVFSKLDEDFLRSQTLWPEVSKLYGHVYEIACIAASTTRNIIASASQSTKPQFAAIILWDATTWEKLGEFPFHKLNVSDMEFTTDGSRLLSVSRDRTWAVWNVIASESEKGGYLLKLIDSNGFHTRALWVGTWHPTGRYFATGARDKKLAVWTQSEAEKYEKSAIQNFDSSVSAAAINDENYIAVGLESGSIFVLSYKESSIIEILATLNHSLAHHDTVERLRFNPKDKYQLASVGKDKYLKIYQLITNASCS